MAERVFLIETTGCGAGKEDMHALTAHEDGKGLLVENHWHAGSPSQMTEDGMHELRIGFTVLPEGLRQIRDAIDSYLRKQAPEEIRIAQGRRDPKGEKKPKGAGDGA